MEKCLQRWIQNFLNIPNEKEFYDKIPEEIYSIYDCAGNFIGDLLESDYVEFHDKGIIINTDEYVLQGFPEGYPVDIATYFVSKEHQNTIPKIKKKRCVVVILDDPKWKRQMNLKNLSY